MKIRITGAQIGTYWYAKKIGEVFEVTERDDDGDYVVAHNGETDRFCVTPDDCEIVRDASAPIDGITVLPDESLGGLLREYLEVKRKAIVGDLFTRIEGGFMYVPGIVYKAEYVDDTGAKDARVEHRLYHENYVVLEPTDIVYVNDPDGVGRKYRMVGRKAAVGERVVMTAATGTRIVEGRSVPDYHNGDTFVIERMGGGDLAVSTAGKLFYHREYSVLEPVTDEAETTHQPLSTRPATEQAAENIAALTAKVQTLESRLNALYDWHKRAAIDLRVAREDIVLIEEGVSDDIERLDKRVGAMELSGAFAGKTTPKKSAQQLRDEIVERAKADVKKITDDIYGDKGEEAWKRYDTPGHVNVTFRVDCNKRTVVALLGLRYFGNHIYERGTAKCAPNDVFNAHIGRAISLRRALGLEIPAEYLSAPNPEEIRVGDVVNEMRHTCRKNRVVEAVRPSGYVEADRGITFVGGGWTFIDACEIIDDTREEWGAA